MASKDAEGSEQGRLLRDALEFNKPQVQNAAAQQPADKAPAQSQGDFKAGELLGGKYTVVEVLGSGNVGVTYKVSLQLHLASFSPVLLKRARLPSFLQQVDINVAPPVFMHCLSWLQLIQQHLVLRRLVSMSVLLSQAEQPGGGAVAIKALSLRTMADWKQLELFEKEVNALRSLNHPGIPAYKDYFEVDSDGDRAYFLVQV